MDHDAPLAPSNPEARARFEEVIDRVAALFDVARASSCRIVHVRVAFSPGCPEASPFVPMFQFMKQHSALLDGSPGGDFDPRLSPRPGETIITKRGVSAFVGTELDRTLRIPRYRHAVAHRAGHSLGRRGHRAPCERPRLPRHRPHRWLCERQPRPTRDGAPQPRAPVHRRDLRRSPRRARRRGRRWRVRPLTLVGAEIPHRRRRPAHRNALGTGAGALRSIAHERIGSWLPVHGCWERTEHRTGVGREPGENGTGVGVATPEEPT